MTDKYLIDSHKYHLHPGHAANVINYLQNPDDEECRQSYKRQHPLYIEVSPVGACNHRCTFCAVDYIGYKSIFMDIKSYKASIDSMKGKGCKSIMFAGEGEPLLHPEINEMVEYTKESGGIDVSFTTNAVKLNDTFIEKSLRYSSWIKVSFNGGDEESYSTIHRTKKDDYHKVLDNIRKAVDYKKKHGLNTAIGLQTLLLPENIDSIPNLCNTCKELGVDYVVIKPYSQHKMSNTTQYSNIDYSQYLDLGDTLKKYNTKEFNVVFRINTIKNWISQNEDRYCKCMATPSTWAYIMADGDVYTCSAYLLDERFRLGNINELNFDQIWNSEKRLEHSNYILNELDINECRVNCRMDQINRYIDKIVNNKADHVNFI
ncbi:radical SAM protein [Synechococcus sp. AH-551-E05]|nr:radical SAM protein [Synechococcus sp. AH-551-E05]MDB4651309.1 radical SAM protein [Synechococcus sp. AH-551-E05]